MGDLRVAEGREFARLCFSSKFNIQDLMNHNDIYESSYVVNKAVCSVWNIK